MSSSGEGARVGALADARADAAAAGAAAEVIGRPLQEALCVCSYPQSPSPSRWVDLQHFNGDSELVSHLFVLASNR